MKLAHPIVVATLLLAAISAHAGDPIPGVDVNLGKDFDNSGRAATNNPGPATHRVPNYELPSNIPGKATDKPLGQSADALKGGKAVTSNNPGPATQRALGEQLLGKGADMLK